MLKTYRRGEIRRELSDLNNRLSVYVRETPLHWIAPEELGLSGLPLAMKLELLQRGGGVGARGAYAFCANLPLNVETVVCTGCPEDCLALVQSAAHFNFATRVYLSAATPYEFVSAMRCLRANLIFSNKPNALMRRSAQNWARKFHAAFYNGGNDPVSLMGFATVGLELEQQSNSQQTDKLDTLLVPSVDGSVVAGLADYFEGRVKLIAVESNRSPALFLARQFGWRPRVDVSGVAANGISERRVSRAAHRIANSGLAEVLIVSDASIREAQYRLWENLNLAVSATGALGVAALISGKYTAGVNERVGVLLSSAYRGPIEWDRS